MTTQAKTPAPALRATGLGLRKRGMGVAQRLSEATPVARAAATALIHRWPAALEATRAAIRTTTRVVNAMPTSAIRALAAGSAGLGAGLYLGGAPRLVAAAGDGLRAVVFGAAALSRSVSAAAPDAGESAADRDDESQFDDDSGPLDASRVG